MIRESMIFCEEWMALWTSGECHGLIIVWVRYIWLWRTD